MSLEAWQVGLRRQFGQEQKFKLENLGTHPIFSDFQIVNPQSKSAYRVAIRGVALGDNFCSCPDFATNTLGTCKHIEFALAKLRRQKGVSSALRAGYQPSHSEVFLRYGARREVRLRLGNACPPELRRLTRDYFDSDGVLLPEAFEKFEEFLAASTRFEHELKCYEDVLGFVAELRDRQRREDRLSRTFPNGIRSAAFDKLLKVPLYDYQRQGALFAAGAGRCLIGDEMGLGKTIQAIAAAQIMAREFGVERVLIVCPTSLKHQWEREITRFAERSVKVIGGLRAKRQQDFAASTFYKITNYDTIHRDLDLIAAWSPDLVILDEAQRIKNWNTRTARSVKRIASPYAIVLTGTPLENRLEELVSIIQFVDRHRLGPTFRFLADHQIHDEETGRVIGYKELDSIGKTLEPILLRRRKQQVLSQLPGRLDKHLFVPMTDQQMGHHEENKEIVAKIVAKWRRFKFLSEADQRRLMIALQNMRMSCDSTYLLDHQTDYGVKADELTTLLGEILEQPDTKVVIFSQWLRMHELVARRLNRNKWGHVMFHGGVSSQNRGKLIDRFREDDRCRAFLATDAGGVGLNLQNASVVVNVDLPWNPAVLEQRIGRVHRLGQSQPVRVVNFVAQGTIEEGMLSVLKFKKSLFSGALDGGEKEVFLGGSRLNKFMETVEKTTSAIPEPAAQDPSIEPEREAQTTGEEEQSTNEASRAGADGAVGVIAASADPWSGLLQTGLSLLQQLARGKSSADRGQESGGLNIVHRDPKTGESYLKIPAPSPEVVDRILGAVSAFLEQLRR
ncbi:MAG TPA: DEAD/DEAH box helicase [Tepidisphaeraceae bacterium]|nr:DEAD/DEAH box helicase [Tepidisphaeraceae bacterium]